jgi:hypothetical protein
VSFAGPSLRGVWGSGPGSVWVAPYQGPIQHWNGSTWDTASVTTPDALLGMAGTGPSDVWAVGLRGGVFHYDGATWSPTPTAGWSTQVFWAAWANAPNDVWVAGGSGVERWNGTAWSP